MSKDPVAWFSKEPIGYLSEGGAERLVAKKQAHEQIKNFRLFAHDVPVYITPPQPTKLFGPNLVGILNAAGFYRKKEWVGLTDEEKQDAYLKIDAWNNCVNWIETTLREKNK